MKRLGATVWNPLGKAVHKGSGKAQQRDSFWIDTGLLHEMGRTALESEGLTRAGSRDEQCILIATALDVSALFGERLTSGDTSLYERM